MALAWNPTVLTALDSQWASRGPTKAIWAAPGWLDHHWYAVKTALVAQWGAAPARSNWGGLLGWIEDRFPNVYTELWLIDRACSGILFGDPNHTLSWNIATEAAAGNPIAVAICDALNALSPNHCANSLTSGS
jgi:hypothetical protein